MTEGEKRVCHYDDRPMVFVPKGMMKMAEFVRRLPIRPDMRAAFEAKYAGKEGMISIPGGWFYEETDEVP